MAIALFGAVDTAVSAIGRNGTQIGALPWTVGIGAISSTQVTLFRTVRDAVATVVRKCAVGFASSVVSVVDAVIALLPRVFETVAAFEVATRIARVASTTVVGTVVALFAAIELAVATSGGGWVATGAVDLASPG